MQQIGIIFQLFKFFPHGHEFVLLRYTVAKDFGQKKTHLTQIGISLCIGRHSHIFQGVIQKMRIDL